ncbi:hypothetical protein K1X76_06485 [bacterium]|nr:hypothetical protein [bacterium]
MKYIFIIILFFMSAPVFAGSRGDMCDALKDVPPWVKNDYIVEVSLQPQAGKYPDKYRLNNWMPDEAELKKVQITAKVVGVIKGGLKVGDSLPPQYSIGIFSSTNHTGAFWADFFSRKKVTLLTGPTLDDWAGEAYSSPIPAVNVDYLEGYKKYKEAVIGCR